MSNEWASLDQAANDGFQHAAGHSSVGYDPNVRKNRCIAKDHTCKGFRIKGSKYCAGHDKAVKAKEATAQAQRDAIRQAQATAAADARFEQNMAAARERMWGST